MYICTCFSLVCVNVCAIVHVCTYVHISVCVCMFIRDAAIVVTYDML